MIFETIKFIVLGEKIHPKNPNVPNRFCFRVIIASKTKQNKKDSDNLLFWATSQMIHNMFVANENNFSKDEFKKDENK